MTPRDPSHMTRTRRDKLHRSAVLAFMAVVTIGLLGLAFAEAGQGAAGWVEVVVYSLAAGFGLEFLGSAWAGAGTGLDDGAG